MSAHFDLIFFFCHILLQLLFRVFNFILPDASRSLRRLTFAVARLSLGLKLIHQLVLDSEDVLLDVLHLPAITPVFFRLP